MSFTRSVFLPETGPARVQLRSVPDTFSAEWRPTGACGDGWPCGSAELGPIEVEASRGPQVVDLTTRQLSGEIRFSGSTLEPEALRQLAVVLEPVGGSRGRPGGTLGLQPDGSFSARVFEGRYDVFLLGESLASSPEVVSGGVALASDLDLTVDQRLEAEVDLLDLTLGLTVDDASVEEGGTHQLELVPVAGAGRPTSTETRIPVERLTRSAGPATLRIFAGSYEARWRADPTDCPTGLPCLGHRIGAVDFAQAGPETLNVPVRSVAVELRQQGEPWSTGSEDRGRIRFVGPDAGFEYTVEPPTSGPARVEVRLPPGEVGVAWTPDGCGRGPGPNCAVTTFAPLPSSGPVERSLEVGALVLEGQVRQGAEPVTAGAGFVRFFGPDQVWIAAAAIEADGRFFTRLPPGRYGAAFAPSRDCTTGTGLCAPRVLLSCR